MGFNKRYITKETILNAIKNGDSISKLVKADALITDNWASKFLDNYNFSSNYQTLRVDIIKDTQYSSMHKSILDHENFNSLKFLGNAFEGLHNADSWLDILLTKSIIEFDVPKDDYGKFEKLRISCINAIDNYFTLESRDEKIESITAR